MTMSRADELDLLETFVQRGRVLAFYIYFGPRLKRRISRNCDMGRQ